MKTHLTRHGIQHVVTPPYTPEWNGTAERYGQTIVTMMLAMMYGNNVPRFLWPEAAKTAAYLINRCPSSKQGGITPHEAWKGTKPNVAHIRKFWTPIFVRQPKEKREKGKLGDRTIEGRLVGYEEQEGKYRIYISSQRQIIVSRDVVSTRPTWVGVICLLPV